MAEVGPRSRPLRQWAKGIPHRGPVQPAKGRVVVGGFDSRPRRIKGRVGNTRWNGGALDLRKLGRVGGTGAKNEQYQRRRAWSGGFHPELDDRPSPTVNRATKQNGSKKIQVPNLALGVTRPSPARPNSCLRGASGGAHSVAPTSFAPPEWRGRSPP